jgi:rare lipoprotein A
VPPPASAEVERPPGLLDEGLASWYGPGFEGRRTANGERFTGKKLTAAHRSLPFGTIVEVRNLDNGRSVQVRINDRGPFVKRRVIDLSRSAAQEIGLLGPGTARVAVFALDGTTLPPQLRDELAAPKSTGDRLALQIAAFHDMERAEAVIAQLKRAFPTIQVRGDGIWFRVQLGQFADAEEAEPIRQELAERGWQAILVPQDEPGDEREAEEEAENEPAPLVAG